jgi:hypothetical protein
MEQEPFVTVGIWIAGLRVLFGLHILLLTRNHKMQCCLTNTALEMCVSYFLTILQGKPTCAG